MISSRIFILFLLGCHLKSKSVHHFGIFHIADLSFSTFHPYAIWKLFFFTPRHFCIKIWNIFAKDIYFSFFFFSFCTAVLSLYIWHFVFNLKKVTLEILHVLRIFYYYYYYWCYIKKGEFVERNFIYRYCTKYCADCNRRRKNANDGKILISSFVCI